MEGGAQMDRSYTRDIVECVHAQVRALEEVARDLCSRGVSLETGVRRKDVLTVWFGCQS